MPDTPAFLAERLKAEGEKTVEFFASLDEMQWALPVYTEGETWTVRGVLAHFVSAERELLRLLADVRDGNPGAREDFDVDRYNASQQRKTAELSVPELLEQFRAARSAMAAFVATLAAPDLEKRGRHPYLGVMAMGEMIKVVYRHNQLHFRDVRRALSA